MTPLKVIAELAQAAAASGSFVHSENFASLIFESWMQSWSDTSCGYGGIAGQAFTDSTVATFRYGDGPIGVFIAGRYAYLVLLDDPRFDLFKAAAELRAVSGADDWQRYCRHRVPKNSNVCDFCQRGQDLQRGQPERTPDAPTKEHR